MDLTTLCEQILILRLDFARNLLNSIRDFCAGVRPEGLESGMSREDSDSGVEDNELDRVFATLKGLSCCGLEGSGEEDSFRRFAGWNRSIRVLEEAITLCLCRKSFGGKNCPDECK